MESFWIFTNFQHKYLRMIHGCYSDSKYTQWYFSIINKAKSDRHIELGEKHHIIPRSLGGSNSKSNLVLLTLREHFVCHLLLVKMTTGRDQKKMLHALHWMMTSRDIFKKTNSLIYEKLRQRFSSSMKGANNPMFGISIPCSETKRKNILKGLQSSKAFQDCHTDEWRTRISLAQSRGIIVLDEESNVVGEWPNCRLAAAELGCTTANIKAAIRNQTCIGKKLKSLRFQSHRVRWK